MHGENGIWVLKGGPLPREHSQELVSCRASLWPVFCTTKFQAIWPAPELELPSFLLKGLANNLQSQMTFSLSRTRQPEVALPPRPPQLSPAGHIHENLMGYLSCHPPALGLPSSEAALAAALHPWARPLSPGIHSLYLVWQQMFRWNTYAG